jgi:hypothetical protein
MGCPSWVRASLAALALLLCGVTPGAAQAPTKTYTVELDAEKDYFAAGSVTIVATSRAAGEVPVGEMDVTIRRRITVSVPADARELVFRTGKNITARLRLTAAAGKIIVRPLSNASSASGIAWMLGRRNGIAVERLVVEFVER